MNDDVKELRMRIDEAIRRITSGTAPMRIPAEKTDPDLVLAACREYLDGEPARLAAACDRRAEEVRESCAIRCEGDIANGNIGEVAAKVCRDTPLTATPLADAHMTERNRWADELRTLRERIEELEAYAKLADDDAECEERRADEAVARAEKAERDALAEKWGHAVATADEVTRLTGRSTATIGGLAVESVAEAVKRVVAERDALRERIATAVRVLHDGDQQAPVGEQREVVVEEALSILRSEGT